MRYNEVLSTCTGNKKEDLHIFIFGKHFKMRPEVFGGNAWFFTNVCKFEKQRTIWPARVNKNSVGHLDKVYCVQ